MIQLHQIHEAKRLKEKLLELIQEVDWKVFQGTGKITEPAVELHGELLRAVKKADKLITAIGDNQ